MKHKENVSHHSPRHHSISLNVFLGLETTHRDTQQYKVRCKYTSMFYITMAQAQVPQLPTVQEFESFKLMAIGHQFEDNNKATIAWCRQHGLLSTEQECDVCQVPCREGLYRSGIDGIILRGPNYRKAINVRKGSFF